MSDCNSTRSPFRPTLLRRYAARAVEIYRRRRESPTAAIALEQLINLARIRVRLAARANRHELGAWRLADTAGAEHIACSHCGARAYLVRVTARENVDELLARRCTL